MVCCLAARKPCNLAKCVAGRPPAARARMTHLHTLAFPLQLLLQPRGLHLLQLPLGVPEITDVRRLGAAAATRARTCARPAGGDVDAEEVVVADDDTVSVDEVALAVRAMYDIAFVSDIAAGQMACGNGVLMCVWGVTLWRRKQHRSGTQGATATRHRTADVRQM